MTIKLKKKIQQDSTAQTDDVLKIKRALITAGYYETPSYGLTPYPDRELFNAIKRFQKDENLKVDGTIAPDGEMLEAINHKLENGLPGVKAPILRCPLCGGPHGGSKGDLCPDCDLKS